MSKENQKLSEKEILEKKEKAVKFYKEEIKFLKVEAEYEELLAKISTARIQRVLADRKFVEFMAQEQEMMKKAKELAKESDK